MGAMSMYSTHSLLIKRLGTAKHSELADVYAKGGRFVSDGTVLTHDLHAGVPCRKLRFPYGAPW